MRQLNTFLAAEGITDFHFLPVLLERALAEMCLRHGIAVAPVQPLHVRVQQGETKHRAVCRVARSAAAGMSLLFFHYDGSANPDRETAKYWTPLSQEWETGGPERPLVRVMPVREMESWALADTDTLRTVAGSAWDGVGVFEAERLPKVERLSDPKRTLREIIAAGRRKRRRDRRPEDYLPLLGERMSLQSLAHVSSYQRWWSETETALRRLELVRD